jgi:holin-like protein
MVVMGVPSLEVLAKPGQNGAGHKGDIGGQPTDGWRGLRMIKTKGSLPDQVRRVEWLFSVFAPVAMPAIFLLLLFQLLGELSVRLLPIPLSGNLAGMLLLFLFLVIHGRVPESLATFAPKFLQHLTLYFLPVSAGVMTLGALLAAEGLRISLVMVLSTIIPLVAVAALLDFLLKGRKHV